MWFTADYCWWSFLVAAVDEKLELQKDHFVREYRGDVLKVESKEAKRSPLSTKWTHAVVKITENASGQFITNIPQETSGVECNICFESNSSYEWINKCEVSWILPFLRLCTWSCSPAFVEQFIALWTRIPMCLPWGRNAHSIPNHRFNNE